MDISTWNGLRAGFQDQDIPTRPDQHSINHCDNITCPHTDEQTADIQVSRTNVIYRTGVSTEPSFGLNDIDPTWVGLTHNELPTQYSFQPTGLPETPRGLWAQIAPSGNGETNNFGEALRSDQHRPPTKFALMGFDVNVPNPSFSRGAYPGVATTPPFMHGATAGSVLRPCNTLGLPHWMPELSGPEMLQSVHNPMVQNPDHCSHVSTQCRPSMPVQHGGPPTIVPWRPHSLRCPPEPLVIIPSQGYDLSLDMHGWHANVATIESATEVIRAQLDPRLPPDTSNVHAGFAPNLLPAESLRGSEVEVVHTPTPSDVSTERSFESQISTWDVKTGEDVPIRTKRPFTEAERIGSQNIRNLGGQCDHCRNRKRKVCTSLTTDSISWRLSLTSAMCRTFKIAQQAARLHPLRKLLPAPRGHGSRCHQRDDK